MSIEISPDQINEYISKALLDSAVGEALKTVIDKKVKELGLSYNNPFEPIVQQYILQAAKELIESQFKEAIAKKVQESLTDEVMARLVDAAWGAIIDKMTR